MSKIKKAKARDELLDIIKMPWGGDRNLALRDWLGLYEGEIGMINMGGILQCVVRTHNRAKELDKKLHTAFPADQIAVQKNGDGAFLVWCDVHKRGG